MAEVVWLWLVRVYFTWWAYSLVALLLLRHADEFLTTIVLCFDSWAFVVLAAFWFWALDVSAFLWDAYVLVAAVVNLVGHELLVELALWNLWTVSVEALYITLGTARAYSADITVLVPRFLEDTWALVLVNTIGLFWWNFNTSVSWATFTCYWWVGLDSTFALDLGFLNGWADLLDVVANTRMRRALAWIF
jgi:hypothetical protein